MEIESNEKWIELALDTYKKGEFYNPTISVFGL